jgi:hypothetical protein
VLYYHDGGFVMGRDGYDAPLRKLALASGCLIVSPEWRLAPDHRFPDAPRDALAVARWLGGSAPALGASARVPPWLATVPADTPVVRVTGGSNKRVSLAALICVKPGCWPRLIYRVHRGRGHCKDRRKGFAEADYARLLDAAHQQLAGPLVIVSDNLNAHVSAMMTELIAARHWLTVYQLPPYAHELNPVEWTSSQAEAGSERRPTCVRSCGVTLA